MAPPAPSAQCILLDDFVMKDGCQIPGKHSKVEDDQKLTAVIGSFPSDDKVTKLSNTGNKWRQAEPMGKGGALQALLAAPESINNDTSKPHGRSSHLSQLPLSSHQTSTYKKNPSTTTKINNRPHGKNGSEQTKGRRLTENSSHLASGKSDHEAGVRKRQSCSKSLGHATLPATATSTRPSDGANGRMTGGNSDILVQDRGQRRGNVSPGPSLHGLEKKMEMLMSEWNSQKWNSVGSGSHTQVHNHLDAPEVDEGGEESGTVSRTVGDGNEERAGSSGRVAQEECGSESPLLDPNLRSDVESTAATPAVEGVLKSDSNSNQDPPAVAPALDKVIAEDTRSPPMATSPAETASSPGSQESQTQDGDRRLVQLKEGKAEGRHVVIVDLVNTGGRQKGPKDGTESGGSSPDRLSSGVGLMTCFGGRRVGSMKRSRVGVEVGKDYRMRGGEKKNHIKEGRVSSLMRRMLRVGDLPLPHHAAAPEAKDARDWSAQVTSLGKSAAECKEQFSEAAAHAMHQVEAADAVLHVLSRFQRLQSAATHAQVGNIIHEFLPLHVLLEKVARDEGAGSMGGQLEAHARGWFVDFVTRAMSELSEGQSVLGLQVKLDLVARLKGVEKWAKMGKKSWKAEGAEGHLNPKEIDVFLVHIHNFIVTLK